MTFSIKLSSNVAIKSYAFNNWVTFSILAFPVSSASILNLMYGATDEKSKPIYSQILLLFFIYWWFLQMYSIIVSSVVVAKIALTIGLMFG